jgi:hypothetical protein
VWLGRLALVPELYAPKYDSRQRYSIVMTPAAPGLSLPSDLVILSPTVSNFIEKCLSFSKGSYLSNLCHIGLAQGH